MRLTVTETGVAQAAGRLDLLAAQLAEPRDALIDAADALMSAERDQFRTADGWAPLAASTKRRKARQGLSPRTLVARGDLERAVTVRGAQGQILVVQGATLRLGVKSRSGTSLFYGAYQNRRRPLFRLDYAARGQIRDATQRGLLRT